MADENEVWVVDEPYFEEHYARGSHPERPERLQAAREGLRTGLGSSWSALKPLELARDIATQVHGAAYIDGLDDVLGQWGHLDPDTYVCPTSGLAIWGAAGAAMAVAEKVSEADAIALVRPPGHHARPNAAMGFCVLNNVAIAAAAALARGAKRVAIFDWDVHHGNGTQEMFWEDERVVFISMHQFPFYPGTGAPEEIGEGAGRFGTINVALPAGSGPEAYAEAFRRVVRPALRAASPDALFISAGFDAHARDPLAMQELDASTYGAFTTALRRDHERLGFLLEGGYDLEALSASLRSVGEALRGTQTELAEGALRDVEREAIERTLRAHEGSPYL